MLKQRIITAVILLCALGLALYFVPPAQVWMVFSGIVSLAAWEWAGLMRQSGPARVIYAILLFVLSALFQTYALALTPLLILLGAVFWVGIAPVWLRRQWRLVNTPILGMVLGAILLIAVWRSFCVLQEKSAVLLIAVMAVVWVADVFAYFAGRRFGRNKLAPTISPGKTWEGVGGAMVGVIAYCTLLLNVTEIKSSWTLGVAGSLAVFVAVTGISVIGDLFESMLKRQAQIKDSSSLLPGHGGVLDRIDSLISTLPVAVLIMSWMT